MARRKKLCCLAAMCLAAAAQPAHAQSLVKVSAPTPVVVTQASAQKFIAPPPAVVDIPAPSVGGYTPPVAGTPAAPQVVGSPGVVSQPAAGEQIVVAGPTVVSDPAVSLGPLDVAAQVFEIDWVGMSFRAPPYRVWVNADFMVATLRGTQTPPLITTSPDNIAKTQAAVLGTNSNVVFGGGNLDNNSQPGARIFAGFFLPNNSRRGFEIGGFVLGERTMNGGAAGTGDTNSVAVGRPFTETNTGTPTAALSAFKGELAGGSTASLTTNLWGAEANFLSREEMAEFLHLTLLAGVRYVDLEQRIDIQDVSTPMPGSTIPFAGKLAITNPNSVRVVDSFRVRDQFIGGQIGIRGSVDVGRIELGAAGKVALGSTYQTLNINGASAALAPNGSVIVNSPGGLLANSGNIGNYSRDVASVIPELELKLGYRLTNNLTCYVSYNFLYWDNVALAGSQIPRNVDLTKVPTSALFTPVVGTVAAAPVIHSDFYMNSLFFGASLKY